MPLLLLCLLCFERSHLADPRLDLIALGGQLLCRLSSHR